MPSRSVLLLFRLVAPANTASRQNTSLCKGERMLLSHFDDADASLKEYTPREVIVKIIDL